MSRLTQSLGALTFRAGRAASRKPGCFLAPHYHPVELPVDLGERVRGGLNGVLDLQEPMQVQGSRLLDPVEALVLRISPGASRAG